MINKTNSNISSFCIYILVKWIAFCCYYQIQYLWIPDPGFQFRYPDSIF